jgi:hypothetical protein
MRRLLVFLLCASAGPAFAGRVVPMLPVMKPAPSPELREKFQESVARGLSQEPGLMATGEVRGRLSTAPDLLDCSTPICMPRVATVLKGDRIVVTEINQSGKTYDFKIHVYEPDGKEVGKPISDTCDICSFKEADEALTKAAAKALPMVAYTPPAPVIPASTSKVEDGPDAPRLSAIDQPKPVQPKVEPPPPVTRPTEPVQPAPPVVEKKDEGSHFPYRPVAYAGFGLAAVSLIATITFSVYASRQGVPTCDLPNPMTSCPNIYSGNTGPAVFFGLLTGVSAATGILLLYLDGKRAKRATNVGLVPTRDGFAAAASFEF